MLRFRCYLVVAAVVIPWMAMATDGDEASIAVYESSESYTVVRENIELAITGRGLLISKVLAIGDMLERTGKDLGFERQTYVKAESIAFCSARMTHRITALDPRNIAVCPLTIAVYVTAAAPDRVQVVFQPPQLVGEGAEIEAAAFALLDSIAREAVE